MSNVSAAGLGNSPRTRASKRGTPNKSLFTGISSSSVRTVADIHRLAAYKRTSPVDELSGGTTTNTNNPERP